MSRGPRRGAGVLVAVVVVLAGCRDGSEPRATSTAPVPTTTTAAAPVLPPLPTPDTTPVVLEADVDQLVLTEADLAPILSGFQRVPDGAYPGTGPLDLETAASAEVDAAREAERLVSFGFESGFGVAFEADDGRVATCAVYRFRDAAAAGFYVLDGAERLLARTGTPFDVTDPPGAFGFTQVDETEAGSFVGHGVVFTVGAHFFVCVVGGPGSSASADDARALASAQSARARTFVR